MSKLDQLQRGWMRLAENRIRCAQEDGKFDDLPGLGCPLEELMDLEEPDGWIKRTMRDIAAAKPSGGKKDSLPRATNADSA